MTKYRQFNGKSYFDLVSQGHQGIPDKVLYIARTKKLSDIGSNDNLPDVTVYEIGTHGEPYVVIGNAKLGASIEIGQYVSTVIQLDRPSETCTAIAIVITDDAKVIENIETETIIVKGDQTILETPEIALPVS